MKHRSAQVESGIVLTISAKKCHDDVFLLQLLYSCTQIDIFFHSNFYMYLHIFTNSTYRAQIILVQYEHSTFI